MGAEDLTEGNSEDVADKAIARIAGAPYHNIPEELYIPPDALEVFLEAFEGPLDLLLYLIRRENIDILDIPIALITQQYMSYIDIMSEFRMELAAEYLLMAAMLAEIKSRMLLPRPEAVEEEEEDPRAELVRRLQEYERFKKAAEAIDQLPRVERDVFPITQPSKHLLPPKPLPTVSLQEILRAYSSVLKRQVQLSHHHIQREPLSVRERMSKVLGRLQDSTEGRLKFTDLLLSKEGRAGAVVSLLAILELNKETLLEIIQDEPLAPIVVRLREAIQEESA